MSRVINSNSFRESAAGALCSDSEAADSKSSKYWSLQSKHHIYDNALALLFLAVNCKVGEWKSYGECSKPCGLGSKTRTRKVLQEPRNGGQKCPVLKESTVCIGKRCKVQRHLGARGRSDLGTTLCNIFSHNTKIKHPFPSLIILVNAKSQSGTTLVTVGR